MWKAKRMQVVELKCAILRRITRRNWKKVMDELIAGFDKHSNNRMMRKQFLENALHDYKMQKWQ